MTGEARGRTELAARLALLSAGHATASRALDLILRAGSGIDALALVRSELGRDAWARVASDSTRERVRRARRAIETAGIRVLYHEHEAYPERLRRLGAQAPPLLFTLGDVALLNHNPAVAIVGSRNATAYGRDMAEQIGGAVARAGGCVVSGMARGVDGAAHEAALDAGGCTIGVLGCGVDVTYPHEHAQLQRDVARNGLLLSEQLPGDPPRRYTFKHRNRIIAALSDAVVVVEAAARSGALSTAGHAATHGVDVYGVPNALHLESAQGVLGLLRDGARTFTGIREFLEDVGLLRVGDEPPAAWTGEPDAEDPAPDGLTDSPQAGRAAVWRALGRGRPHVDRIAAASGVTAGEALSLLLELELDGLVEQHAGQRFGRVARRHRAAAAHGVVN